MVWKFLSRHIWQSSIGEKLHIDIKQTPQSPLFFLSHPRISMLNYMQKANRLLEAYYALLSECLPVHRLDCRFIATRTNNFEYILLASHIACVQVYSNQNQQIWIYFCILQTLKANMSAKWAEYWVMLLKALSIKITKESQIVTQQNLISMHACTEIELPHCMHI